MEEERKFEVDEAFALPDEFLDAPDVFALPPVRLRATYFDTADLRLARAGASLRFRTGDAEPWTVKLPTAIPGIRREVSLAGPSGRPPAELADLVTTFRRSEPLAPVIVLRTVRQPYELRDGSGTVLAELVDDHVSVLVGRRVVTRFREIEVERKAGGRDVLDRVAGSLTAAGAVEGEFTAKHVRALGSPATAPADLAASPRPVSRKKATAADVVAGGIRRDIGVIVAHDPLVRLRAEVGRGDTAVHQMRVGCRRLRSRLRTFAPLLDPRWADPLRAELSWLASVLGGVRDAEVLRARLGVTAAADPLAPLDPEIVGELDRALADRYRDAVTELDAALTSERYLELLDLLVTVAAKPGVGRGGRAPAREALPPFVARTWKRLVRDVRGLRADGPDEVWHAARVRAKRARYAVEAVSSVVGRPAQRLAAALAAVQGDLGEHQDAALAAETWLELGAADPGRYGVTVGRLVERERGAVVAARGRFAGVWAEARRGKLTEWLG
ncbi:CHAD domain-containing protein [Longispora fulva]|uniref:CHAD domain-containing protein n=1 Tax=Longispora fulva TaxID=619741 RepID=A0A8J7GZH8_9ACTN|nr:CYTH and CHAD domain-containing protein [Longispora fulva]MBG6141286.1 CHAD domain-containing protein [Longispora fulva]GIG62717.1 CHAD domain-containing protein [Longispora fulva]